MKEHLWGQPQHGVLLYTVPSSLRHGPRRFRGGLAPLSLAQSPYSSGLLETGNPGRESKRAAPEGSPSCLSPRLGQAVHKAGPSGVAGHQMEQGSPTWYLWEWSMAALLGISGKGPSLVLKPQL